MDKERLLSKHEDNAWDPNGKASQDLSTADDMLEQEGSAVHHPLIVPVNRDLNSDIYFIGKRGRSSVITIAGELGF